MSESRQNFFDEINIQDINLNDKVEIVNFIIDIIVLEIYNDAVENLDETETETIKDEKKSFDEKIKLIENKTDINLENKIEEKFSSIKNEILKKINNK
jgi:hypothetical protein